MGPLPLGIRALCGVDRTGFIHSRFSELEISVVHQEISKLEVNEAMVEYDASAPPAEIAREITSNDSRSVMEEVADALSNFSP